MAFSKLRPSSSQTEGYNEKEVQVSTDKPYRGREERTEIREFYIVKDPNLSRELTVSQDKDIEFVEIDNIIRIDSDGGLVTITGRSNSKGLTFTYGGGDIVLDAIQFYYAENIETQNGNEILTDPGASNDYGFYIQVQVPKNFSSDEIYRDIIVTTTEGNTAICRIYQKEIGPYIDVLIDRISFAAVDPGYNFEILTNHSWASDSGFTIFTPDTNTSVSGETLEQVLAKPLDNSGRIIRTEIRTFYLIDYPDISDTLIISQNGVGEFVKFALTAVTILPTTTTLTINGISNSSRLNFILGGGAIRCQLSNTYSAAGIISNNGDYILGDPGALEEYTFSIVLNIEPNTSPYDRAKEIIVTTNGGFADTMVVTQTGVDRILELNPKTVTFANLDLRPKTTVLTYNDDFEVIGGGSGTFFSLNPFSGVVDDLTDTTITLILTNFAEYTGRLDKTQQKVFQMVAETSVQDILNVVQLGKEEFLTFDVSEINVNSGGGTLYLTGESNASMITFTVILAGSANDLPLELSATYLVNGVSVSNGVTIPGDPGATSQYYFQIAINAPANDTTEIRTAVVRGITTNGVERNCIFSQLSEFPSLVVNPLVIVIPSTGDAQTALVYSRTYPINIRKG